MRFFILFSFSGICFKKFLFLFSYGLYLAIRF